MSWRLSSRQAPRKHVRWWLGGALLTVAIAVAYLVREAARSQTPEGGWPEEPPLDVDSEDAKSTEFQMTPV